MYTCHDPIKVRVTEFRRICGAMRHIRMYTCHDSSKVSITVQEHMKGYAAYMYTCHGPSKVSITEVRTI
jgi:hypothetical protein